MKKKLIALILALCAALSVAAFAACDSEQEGTVIGAGTEYQVLTSTTTEVVFVATEDVHKPISETTSLKNYMDALVYLGEITYSGYEGDYGYYVTTVNGVEEQYYDTYMTYWSVYTNLFELEEVTYATTEYGSYDYNGVTLGSASYGISSLPCVAGYTYALVLSTYTYSY